MTPKKMYALGLAAAAALGVAAGALSNAQALAVAVVDYQPFALKSVVYAQLAGQGFEVQVAKRDTLNSLILSLKNQRALLRQQGTPDADLLGETQDAIDAATKTRDLLQCQIELRKTTCFQ